jgi:hypothetical protein
MEQHYVITDAEREALRQQLLNGLVDDSVMMELLDISKPTLDRHVGGGMPFLKFGRKRFFDIPVCNAWIRNRPQQNATARGRGRPRKA